MVTYPWDELLNQYIRTGKEKDLSRVAQSLQDVWKIHESTLRAIGQKVLQPSLQSTIRTCITAALQHAIASKADFPQ